MVVFMAKIYHILHHKTVLLILGMVRALRVTADDADKRRFFPRESVILRSSALPHYGILTSNHHDVIMLQVRTTLQIDDDLYQAAKSMAAAENRTIGKVVSSLLRKALRPQHYGETDEDIPSFRVSENAPPITLEMVREADEDPE
jgi:hypothetical protein